jgi:glycosyltransferase domain-containing protein
MGQTRGHALTLIVPTFNRSWSLVRALDYYSRKKFRHPILVTDSSSPEVAAINETAIQHARRSIDVQYQRFDPGISPWQKFAKTLNLVATEFAGFCADDDFICPNALDQCLVFLQAHSGYAAAQGCYVTFSIQTTERRNAFCPQRLVAPPPLDQNDPAERLMCHLTNFFPTFYALHRREQLFENLQTAMSHTDENRFAEILPSCLTVIQGKVRRFDTLYSMREFHGRNLSQLSHSWATFLLDQHFSRRFGAIRDAVGEALAENQNSDRDHAQGTADCALLIFLNEMVRRSIMSRGPNLFQRSPILDRAKQILDQFGSIAQHLRRVHSFMRADPKRYVTDRLYRTEFSFIGRLVLEHYDKAARAA